MNWQKIVGAGGWLLSTGAAFYHAVNPAVLGAKGTLAYVAVGALLALFGKQPAAKDDNAGK